MPAASNKSNRRPTFFWQGLLILLPMAVMAVVAGAAIVKDRAQVREEARQRAEEIQEQINGTLGRQVRYHWWEYEMYLQHWSEDAREKSLWPGSALRASCAALRKADAIRMQVRKDVLADSTPSQVDQDSIKFWPVFNADGTVQPRWVPSGFEGRRPVDDPPTPPSWRLQLTAEQLAAWDALLLASFSSRDTQAVANAYGRFQLTRPSYQANQNAEFVVWQADQSGSSSPVQWPAITTPSPPSESGTPLLNLFAAEALKRAVATGPSQPVWDRLAHAVWSEPDFFTPSLLDQARLLTNNDPALSECLDALCDHWNALEQMWSVAAAIQRNSRLQGINATNFWLSFQGSDWFCLLEPTQDLRGDPPGAPAATNESCLYSRLLPRSEIAAAFNYAIVSSRVVVPPYLAVSAEIQGPPPVHVTLSKSGTIAMGNPILAETSGQIPTPSQPSYKLRVQLADANLMFAAQRRRAFLFGCLIFVSAASAVIGFYAARLAFYRQLRLNEMKSNFVSSVSHELRAPIASVRLMAEGLEGGRVQSPEKQREYFRFITQECRRLSSLIENVLDFSRIEQGRKQYEMETTDLVALARQTVRLMETYASEQQINISLTINGKATPADVDGKAIQQALINLIDNAIKHSPKGAPVSVGLDFADASEKSAPHLVQLWVEDKGEGIPLEEQEKIFERFYRIGSELRRQTQGVGIGLSIVKHIVEAHGGRVRVKSAVGAGSRFVIELPALDDGRRHKEPAG